MRKIIIIDLIILYCFVNLCFAQDKNIEMKIIRTSGNKLIANKGSAQGIIKNQIFYIFGNNKIIGKAYVLVTTEDRSGLILIEGKNIISGYILKTGNQDQIINYKIEKATQQKQKESKIKQAIFAIVGISFFAGFFMFIIK